MADPKKVLQMIKEKDIKYVDLRFTDPRGKWQHLAHAVETIEEDTFTDGIMFDGSSIAGWKAINESDMVLMPDADDGGHGSVRGAALADPRLRRLRARHRPALRPRPALDRQEGRGLPAELGRRRHRLFRSGDRVLRVRRRPLQGRHEQGRRTRSTARKAPRSPRSATKTATWATGRRSRAATSRCRRSTAPRTCAPRC